MNYEAECEMWDAIRVSSVRAEDRRPCDSCCSMARSVTDWRYVLSDGDKVAPIYFGQSGIITLCDPCTSWARDCGAVLS